MTTYSEYLAGLEAMRAGASAIPLGGYRPIRWPRLPENAPVAMLCFAHPDDEWLSGMPLGLRLRREGYRLVVVPATLGRPEQYERRLRELSEACRYGGMALNIPGRQKQGLRDQIKGEYGGFWQEGVDAVAAMMRKYAPKILITHHDNDGHHDHKSVCRLVRQALLSARHNGFLVETEYWHDLDSPGLQLEVSNWDVARVLKGTSFHQEEVRRNPYHLTFPFLAMLNRQFSERVTGWGKPAATFRYSVMLRVRRVHRGSLEEYKHPAQLSAREPLSRVFPAD